MVRELFRRRLHAMTYDGDSTILGAEALTFELRQIWSVFFADDAMKL
jgi:hypothetical protein